MMQRLFCWLGLHMWAECVDDPYCEGFHVCLFCEKPRRAR